MFITNVLCKKAKSKFIMVQMQSAVSGHTFTRIRERVADKIEMLRFDPLIQRVSLYRESKKVRSMDARITEPSGIESIHQDPPGLKI